MTEKRSPPLRIALPVASMARITKLVALPTIARWRPVPSRTQLAACARPGATSSRATIEAEHRARAADRWTRS